MELNIDVTSEPKGPARGRYVCVVDDDISDVVRAVLMILIDVVGIAAFGFLVVLARR